MFIAAEKKRNNIVEYILYMWQIENIIRACNFDLSVIEYNVITQLGVNDNEKELVKNWYRDLIKKMKSQGIQQQGHLAELRDNIAELLLLHQTLLQSFQDKTYNMIYNDARPEIADLMKKQDGMVKNEIEACLNGLYGLWLLRVQQKDISDLTEKSMAKISKCMARLTLNYHKMMNLN